MTREDIVGMRKKLLEQITSDLMNGPQGPATASVWNARLVALASVHRAYVMETLALCEEGEWYTAKASVKMALEMLEGIASDSAPQLPDVLLAIDVLRQALPKGGA